MRITVLTVADCPNARPALERVTAALDGRQAQVELVEVADESDAARLGMSGSPTILIDGTDPFAPPGAAPSISCRLYRDAAGTVSGVPDESALRRALAGAAPQARDAGTLDCCPPQPLDVVGRGGRGRRAPAENGLRAVHQQILRHFAATGAAPDAQTLQPVAAVAGRTAAEVLTELADEDFLTLDETGNIRAAYPFSAVPTRHRVRLDSGVEVWSMCAIDALGIPAMLGQDGVISSADPVTGDPITVTSTTGRVRWDPPTAVVFVGQRPGGGPAASACCDALNFFTDTENARTWTSQHPEVPGRIVDQPTAEHIGRQTFGSLLAP
ncbi:MULTISPECIES: alkylmercury lyase family protein [Streptomyces]|uniref:alkylmercury lyase family protein n=1 Tax=Streptomyces TaxID=1883 RepID=UPI00093E7FC2|nr:MULTISPECIES: alkylmercury lyase family protein [unclassified Streptomyces]OKJ09771.1 alkylmercury lyase [Streptomyces sp. TSRI0261]OWA26007.1 alkylmercury lyase [Streptomyces sp. CS057]QNQ32483.1 alkylmercury lyase family protein [Streptomyces sp. CB00271]